MKMKDRFWLWGQDAGSHHAAAGNASWKLPGVNRMGPVEGATYLGINNMCRVVMGGKPKPPFDHESTKLTSMNKVVWSAVGDESSTRNNKKTDLEEVIRQAEKYPNIVGAILDDFFKMKKTAKDIHGRLSLEAILEMRERLHNFHKRRLDLWVVWYKQQMDWDVDDYLELFDVITFWNMRACADYLELDRDITQMIERTPGKRRLLGCYLWNYGEGKPLSVKEIQRECEKYYAWIQQEEVEGIIFCSNTLADLGLEAVEWARNWIKEVGEEEV